MENTELHLEEQRQILLDINKGIKEFKKVLQGQIDITVNQPDEMTVNTEKSVEVTNLEQMKEWVDDLGVVVTKAIEDNSYKPVNEVSIKNVKDILPSKLTISNLSDIKTYFSEVTRAIEKNQPIVNITKQDIVFPRSAKDAIPVRLSDGKGFYNAIAAAISSGSNGQAHLHIGGNPVTTANPIPVDIQDASVTINGDVTISSEVEVKNDSGNPVPISASSLPLPTGASTSAKQDTAQASLSSIDTKLTDNATQTTLATRLSESDFDTKIGSLTETAPATDTASSGLNGRLQRLAQRLTSIIALLPGSLGQKARAASLAVTLSTEDITALTPITGLTDAELRATPVVVDLGANNDVTVAGVSTAGNQTTIIGHLDGVETLLSTIDADTGNLPTIETNTDFGTVTGGGTETGALRVTVANNSTGVLSVDDNGGSLTVDGTVAATQSGTWTEANSAAIKTAVETLDNAISGSEMQVDVVGALPAGTNAIGKLSANSGVDIGDVDVTSSVSATLDHGSNLDIDTTAEQITTTSFSAKFGVTVKSAVDNTDTVYIGNSDVTAGTTAATDGFPLEPGESITLPVNNSNLLYAIGAAANQKVFWSAV